MEVSLLGPARVLYRSSSSSVPFLECVRYRPGAYGYELHPIYASLADVHQHPQHVSPRQRTIYSANATTVTLTLTLTMYATLLLFACFY